MKRKIQANFKSYQKILLLILILLATLLFGFINSSYSAIEGFPELLMVKKPMNKDASVSQYKSAADRRSSGDGKMAQSEQDNYRKHDNLDSG
jgi:hypothetical protein